jgi:hypothetical protein
MRSLFENLKYNLASCIDASMITSLEAFTANDVHVNVTYLTKSSKMIVWSSGEIAGLYTALNYVTGYA